MPWRRQGGDPTPPPQDRRWILFAAASPLAYVRFNTRCTARFRSDPGESRAHEPSRIVPSRGTAVTVDVNPDFRTRLQETRREGQRRSFRRVAAGPYRLSIQASGTHHCEPRRVGPVEEYERSEVAVFTADGRGSSRRRTPRSSRTRSGASTGCRAIPEIPPPGSTYPRRSCDLLRFPGAWIRRLPPFERDRAVTRPLQQHEGPLREIRSGP